MNGKAESSDRNLLQNMIPEFSWRTEESDKTFSIPDLLYEIRTHSLHNSK